MPHVEPGPDRPPPPLLQWMENVCCRMTPKLFLASGKAVALAHGDGTVKVINNKAAEAKEWRPGVNNTNLAKTSSFACARRQFCCAREVTNLLFSRAKFGVSKRRSTFFVRGINRVIAAAGVRAARQVDLCTQVERAHAQAGEPSNGGKGARALVPTLPPLPLPHKIVTGLFLRDRETHPGP